jgi:hypothetical protein
MHELWNINEINQKFSKCFLICILSWTLDKDTWYISFKFPGKIREDMCGYEETTVLPDPIESRPINQGDLVDITYPTPPDPGLSKKIIGGKTYVSLSIKVGLFVYCLIVIWK